MKWYMDDTTSPPLSLYTVYKKTEQIWNCSQLRKTAISILFLVYIASLGIYNAE